MLTGITCLDISDILIQQLEILLTGKVTYATVTRTLGDIESEALALYSLVFLCLSIEIDELDGRNLIFALMTGNSKDIVDHRALQTIGSELGLIGDLSIILVEVLGESHLRLFYEFEVASTTDDYPESDRVIGLYTRLIQLSGDTELTHSTRERSRALR